MIHKKVMRQKFCRIFFRPKMELKVAFGQGVSIRKCIFVQVITTKFQHCHELIHGITIHDTFFTFIRIQKELTGHGIHDASGQVLVLHGVRLITCLLYDDQDSVSSILFDFKFRDVNPHGTNSIIAVNHRRSTRFDIDGPTPYNFINHQILR